MYKLYNKLSNAAKAAIATAVFTFAATASTALIGLLGQVADWVDGGTAPDWSTAVKLIMSAFVAGAAGLLNFAVRYFQQKANPASGPHY